MFARGYWRTMFQTAEGCSSVLSNIGFSMDPTSVPLHAEFRCPASRVCLRRHRAVLVNDAAEHVVATDFVSRVSGAGPVAGDRYLKVDSSMRTVGVVVLDVLGEHDFEVAPSQDEQPVQAFATDGTYPSLGVRVRARCADRCFELLGPNTRCAD